MKNTNTTLRELSRQYRSVLLKCLILNSIFFFPILNVHAETAFNFDPESKTYTIKEEITEVTENKSFDSNSNFKVTDRTLSFLNDEIVGGGRDQFEVKSAGSLIKFKMSTQTEDNILYTVFSSATQNGTELTPDGNLVIKMHKDSVTGKTILTETKKADFNYTIKRKTGTSEEQAESYSNFNSIILKFPDDKLEFSMNEENELENIETLHGTEIEINNSILTLTNADVETNKDIVIHNASKIKYSCIGDNCYNEQDEDYDKIIMGQNVTIGDKVIDNENLKTNIVLGTALSDKNMSNNDMAYLGANGDLNIYNSEITLNDKATLAYEGKVYEDGAGIVNIKDSKITLNDDSQFLLGTDDDEDWKDSASSASLKIQDSEIVLNERSKLKFHEFNPEETTLNSATITMNDSSEVVLNQVTLNQNSEINLYDSASLAVYDVIFNGGAINVDADSTAAIKVNAKTTGINTITFNGTLISADIKSFDKNNIIVFNNDIQFSNLFDPAQATVNGDLTRSGYDDEITYTLNSTASLNYTNDKYLYDASMHTHQIDETRQADNTFADGKYALNSIKFSGGALDLRNGTATAIKLASLTLNDGTTSSIYADVDLAQGTMDRFTDDTTISGTGTLNIAGLNLISDATQEKTPVIFTESANLIGKTNYTGATSGLAYSALYTYDVAYNNGKFEFTRKDSLNPAVYSSSTVSQTVGLLQSNINSIAFAGLSGENNAETGKSAGDIPSAGNAWVKVVGFDDNVDFDSFQTIDSEMFSVVGGMTTDKVKVGSADMNFGFYAGYLNGEQKYTANKIEQNGGYFGLSTSWTKGNVVLDGTINTGFMRNEAENSRGTDKYNTYWAGAGIKAGYNYNFGSAWTLQPNVYAGYTLVDTEDYTSKSGVRIENDKTHLFEVAPGLKLSKDFKNAWKGYVQGKYAILVDKGGDVKANEVALPNISTDNYAEYGIGLEKDLTNAWGMSLTANRRDGGRQGWNGSIEFKYNF